MQDDANTLLVQLAEAKKEQSEPLMVGVCEEICTLLCIGSEDTLQNVDAAAFVRSLSDILTMDTVIPELKVFTMRGIALVLNSVPRSGPSAAEADVIPLAIQLLAAPDLSIQLAEELLKALEALSLDHAQVLLKPDGLQKLLFWMEGLEVAKERTHLQVLTIVCNVCSRLKPDNWNEASMILPVLTNVLANIEHRVVESAADQEDVDTTVTRVCVAIAHMVDRLAHCENLFNALHEVGLLDTLLRTLAPGRQAVAPAVGGAPAKRTSAVQCSFMLRLLAVIYTANPAMTARMFVSQNIFQVVCSLVRRACGVATLDAHTRGGGDDGDANRALPQLFREEASVSGTLEFLSILIPPLPPTQLVQPDILIPCHSWSWEDDYHNFFEFDEVVCHKVEGEYARQRRAGVLKCVDIVATGRSYTLKFSDMREMNKIAKINRAVYRDPIPSHYVRYVRVPHRHGHHGGMGHHSGGVGGHDHHDSGGGSHHHASHHRVEGHASSSSQDRGGGDRDRDRDRDHSGRDGSGSGYDGGSGGHRPGMLRGSNRVHPLDGGGGGDHMHRGHHHHRGDPRDGAGSGHRSRGLHSNSADADGRGSEGGDDGHGASSSCCWSFLSKLRRDKSGPNGPDDEPTDRRVIDSHPSEIDSRDDFPAASAVDDTEHPAYRDRVYLRYLLTHVLPTLLDLIDSTVNSLLLRDALTAAARILHCYHTAANLPRAAAANEPAADARTESSSALSTEPAPGGPGPGRVSGGNGGGSPGSAPPASPPAKPKFSGEDYEALLAMAPRLSRTVVNVLLSSAVFSPFPTSPEVTMKSSQLYAGPDGDAVFTVFGSTLATGLLSINLLLQLNPEVFTYYLQRHGVHEALARVAKIPHVLATRGQVCCSRPHEDHTDHPCAVRHALDATLHYIEQLHSRLNAGAAALYGGGSSTSAAFASTLQAPAHLYIRAITPRAAATLAWLNARIDDIRAAKAAALQEQGQQMFGGPLGTALPTSNTTATITARGGRVSDTGDQDAAAAAAAADTTQPPHDPQSSDAGDGGVDAAAEAGASAVSGAMMDTVSAGGSSRLEGGGDVDGDAAAAVTGEASAYSCGHSGVTPGGPPGYDEGELVDEGLHTKLDDVLRLVTEDQLTSHELLSQHRVVLDYLTAALAGGLPRLSESSLLHLAHSTELRKLIRVLHDCTNLCIPQAPPEPSMLTISHNPKHPPPQAQRTILTSSVIPISVGLLSASTSITLLNAIQDRLGRPFAVRCVPGTLAGAASGGAGGANNGGAAGGGGDYDEVLSVSMFPFATFGCLERWINARRDERFLRDDMRRRATSESGGGGYVPSTSSSSAVPHFPPAHDVQQQQPPSQYPGYTVTGGMPQVSRSDVRSDQTTQASAAAPTSSSSTSPPPQAGGAGGATSPQSMHIDPPAPRAQRASDDAREAAAATPPQSVAGAPAEQAVGAATVSVSMAQQPPQLADDTSQLRAPSVVTPGGPAIIATAAPSSPGGDTPAPLDAHVSPRDPSCLSTAAVGAPHTPVQGGTTASWVSREDVSSQPDADVERSSSVRGARGSRLGSRYDSLSVARAPSERGHDRASEAPSVVTVSGAATAGSMSAAAAVPSSGAASTGAVEDPLPPQAAASSSSNTGGGGEGAVSPSNPTSNLAGPASTADTNLLPLPGAVPQSASHGAPQFLAGGSSSPSQAHGGLSHGHSDRASLGSRSSAPHLRGFGGLGGANPHAALQNDDDTERVHNDTDLPRTLEFCIDGYVIPTRRMTILDAVIQYSITGLAMRKLMAQCQGGDCGAPGGTGSTPPASPSANLLRNPSQKLLLSKALSLWSGTVTIQYRRQAARAVPTPMFHLPSKDGVSVGAGAGAGATTATMALPTSDGPCTAVAPPTSAAAAAAPPPGGSGVEAPSPAVTAPAVSVPTSLPSPAPLQDAATAGASAASSSAPGPQGVGPGGPMIYASCEASRRASAHGADREKDKDAIALRALSSSSQAGTGGSAAAGAQGAGGVPPQAVGAGANSPPSSQPPPPPMPPAAGSLTPQQLYPVPERMETVLTLKALALPLVQASIAETSGKAPLQGVAGENGAADEVTEALHDQALCSALIHDLHGNTLTIAMQCMRPLADIHSDCRRTARHVMLNYPSLIPLTLRIQHFDTLAYGARLAMLRHVQCPLGGTASALRSMIGLNWLRSPGGLWARNVQKKQKCAVSRSTVFQCAEILLHKHSTNPLPLDIYFHGEPGTGLGPTTEFFALVSREFQQSALGLWRTSGERVNGAEGEYAHHAQGLFPQVIGRYPSATRGRVLQRYTFLGRFIGRALRDWKVLDLPFNPLLFEMLLGRSIMGNPAGSLALVEPAYEKGLQHIQSLLDLPDKAEAAEHMESLGIDFTLPGDPAVELTPNGADIALTLDNAQSYIHFVRAMILHQGIQHQMKALLEGINEVFPVSSLQVFSPAELHLLLCGRNADQRIWETVQQLNSDIVCNHGYSRTSVPVMQLIEVVVEMSAEEQRRFLTFISGSPRMPLGGLVPKITIVRRGAEFENLETDGLDVPLPSVNTCFHYLKLPSYPSKDVLRDKLLTAINDGRGSFDLS